MNWFEHAAIWSFIVCIISTLGMAVMAIAHPAAPLILRIAGLVCVTTFSLAVAGFVLQGRFGSKVVGA